MQTKKVTYMPRHRLPSYSEARSFQRTHDQGCSIQISILIRARFWICPSNLSHHHKKSKAIPKLHNVGLQMEGDQSEEVKKQEEALQTKMKTTQFA